MDSQSLLSKIRVFCAETGMAETTFGLRAVNDGKLVARLESGGQCLITTAAKVLDFIAQQQTPTPEPREAVR